MLSPQEEKALLTNLRCPKCRTGRLRRPNDCGGDSYHPGYEGAWGCISYNFNKDTGEITSPIKTRAQYICTNCGAWIEVKDGDYSELEELSEELNEQGAACGEGAIE